MKNFISRLTTRKWLFAISISIGIYLLDMLNAYYLEIGAIKQESLKHFGGDITVNLGFFEVLKSYHSYGFNYWQHFYEAFLLVFIAYLLIAAYFFDYKNEAHVGWRRVYLSAQILIPTLFALYFAVSWLGSVEGNFAYLFIIFFEIKGARLN